MFLQLNPKNNSQPLCSCDFRSNFTTVLRNCTVRKHTINCNFDSDFVTKIVDSFSVDDFTGGENTVENVYLLFKKLKLRFLEGCFNLRKWRMNDRN